VPLERSTLRARTPYIFKAVTIPGPTLTQFDEVGISKQLAGRVSHSEDLNILVLQSISIIFCWWRSRK
jgi:hypothetical protein